MPMRSLSPWSGGRRLPTSDFMNEFEEFINEFDRGMFPANLAKSTFEFTPALDFEDRGDAFLVTVDLPGLKEE